MQVKSLDHPLFIVQAIKRLGIIKLVGISEEPQMTLTYRGQKYDQQKVAGASAKPALTYRGVSYAK